MDNEIFRLKATNGVIIVYEDRAIISHKSFMGFMAQGTTGDRIFFYQDIQSIEYRKPSLITNGYVKFIIAGTKDINAKPSLLGTTVESMKDPNTLVLRAFNKEVPIISEQIYNYIFDKISQNKSNSLSNNIDIPEQIKKIADLKDRGILTENEFNDKKKELLKKM